MKEYKSPVAALLWSITMAGFGQYYNGQYIIGTILFASEILINNFSGINWSIFFSFFGSWNESYETFNLQAGLFYPSVYYFSIWQAYNKAFVINCHQDNRNPPKETYLTGFFFGNVIGMNLGVYWKPIKVLFSELQSPIFNGLILGIIVGYIFHQIEKRIENKKGPNSDFYSHY